MNEQIIFPNLGITFEKVGQLINVFGFEIAYYGILIGIGMFAGIAMAMHEAKRTKQNPETYIDLAMFAIVAAIIGARIYYVAFSWDEYKGDLLSILNTRGGGLAVYGGVIAAVIVLFVFAKKKKLSAPVLLDTAVLGLVIGQIIGRCGNFFNREAFGEYTNNLFAMQLPVDAIRASEITEEMRKHIEQIGGIAYVQVHPTFLYEVLWNGGVLVLLLFYRKYKKFDGELFLLYLGLYGVGRFWIEGLRTDQLLVGNVAVSQVLAGVLIIASIAIIIYKRRRKVDVSKTNIVHEKEQK